MEIREIELPGIGHKYAIRTGDGERLTVIIHNTGHREIYLFEKGADFPKAACRLEDDEGRKLGAILGGAFFQPVGEANLETLLGHLSLDWLDLGPRVDGRTIGELEVRTVTGASVLAILKGEEVSIPNPGPDARLESGDRLVVLGTHEQVEALRELLR